MYWEELKDQEFNEVLKVEDIRGNKRLKQIDVLLDILIMTEAPVYKS